MSSCGKAQVYHCGDTELLERLIDTVARRIISHVRVASVADNMLNRCSKSTQVARGAKGNAAI